MGASAAAPPSTSGVRAATGAPRHSAIVRLAHWVTTLCFVALLLSGLEIVISHPRFYWGEEGNSGTPALFSFPIPASRASVPTGYGYVLPDQNGWSRALHFQTAWALVLTGLAYVCAGFFTRHFRRNLLPSRRDLSWRAVGQVVRGHLRITRPDESDDGTYNILQRLSYIAVIFGLFPLVIWTGLAMSPALVSAFPFMVTVLGGQQSARTLHFFATVLLVLFLLVHVAMVAISGFGRRVRAMVTGGHLSQGEQP